MRIGALAQRTGVNVRLLRYYEQRGLLAPTRQASGYREYTEADVATVKRIRTLLAAGLGTRLIELVLPCVGADADRIVPTCPELLGHLRRERERIAESISQLRSTQHMLDAVLATTA